MREILFRAKRLTNQKWIYGDFTAVVSDYPRIISNKDATMYAVASETVGQYTGLLDKNGKKIFEGDVVTGQFQNKKITGYVKYGTDGSFYIYRKGLFGIGLNNADAWLEVIGNIYDNPELIGEKTND